MVRRTIIAAALVSLLAMGVALVVGGGRASARGGD